MQLLVAAGANIDAQTKEGNTALLHASFRGHLADLQVIICASQSLFGSIVCEGHWFQPDMQV